MANLKKKGNHPQGRPRIRYKLSYNSYKWPKRNGKPWVINLLKGLITPFKAGWGHVKLKVKPCRDHL